MKVPMTGDTKMEPALQAKLFYLMEQKLMQIQHKTLFQMNTIILFHPNVQSARAFMKNLNVLLYVL
jgi:hypothetical protein